MKKSFVAWILACCMLLPACDLGTVSSGSESTSSQSSESEESSSASSNGSSGGDEGNSGGGSNGGGGNPPAGGTCAEEHTDANGDGTCDDCDATVQLTFDFYAVNDLHGKFADGDNHPGVDEMTTYLRQAKQANPNTVIFASGDMWQGSFESNLTYGALATEWMNDLGFVSMTLGNHEYDWGEEKIAANAALAKFPLLAINVYDKTTGRLAEYCQPSVMVKVNGAKIGIIGAEGDVASDIASANIANLNFKVGDELTELVKAESNRLRALGADCIIYSMHDGTDYGYEYSQKDVHPHYNEVLSRGYVDVVFEAHSHQTYKVVDDYGVYHIQSGGDNKTGLSHAKIEINIAREEANVKKVETVYHSAYTSLAPDPIVNTLLTKYEQMIAPAYETLGTNTTKRGSDEVKAICSQLYYEKGEARWGADYDIVLGGGYIGVRAPYEIPKGAVTYGQLLTILPFDNAMQLCSISGKDLQKFMAVDGYRNYYGEYGLSVKDKIDQNKTYYIVVDSYCADSSKAYEPSLTVVDTYQPDDLYARDLLAEYIRAGGLGGGVDAVPKEEAVTVSQALQLGNALASNETTAVEYIVTGRIIEILDSATKEGILYGNMTIEDGRGNTLYVYGSFDLNGNRYGKMANPPVVGDLVTLRAPIQKYVNTNVVNATPKVELLNATIVSFVPSKTVTQALQLSQNLTAGETTAESYYIVGTVDEIRNSSKGNMMIKDASGAKIYVYSPKDASALKVGDAVVFYGKIQYYTGTQADQQMQVASPTLYAIL